MQGYEYRVVPAPVQGKKARGLKSTAERFAHALESLMNEMGAEGWDYVRADTLPCEERSGLTGRSTTFQNLLVFRRPLPAAADDAAAAPDVAGLLAAPLPEADGGDHAPAAAASPVAGARAAPVEAGRLVAALSRPGVGAAPPEPPLTRPAAVTEGAERDTSSAARAAAAALRTYRATGAGKGSGRGGSGLAAE